PGGRRPRAGHRPQQGQGGPAGLLDGDGGGAGGRFRGVDGGGRRAEGQAAERAGRRGGAGALGARVPGAAAGADRCDRPAARGLAGRAAAADTGHHPAPGPRGPAPAAGAPQPPRRRHDEGSCLPESRVSSLAGFFRGKSVPHAEKLIVPALPARSRRSGYGVPSRETSRVPPAPSSPVMRIVRTPSCSWWPSVASFPCRVSRPSRRTSLSVKPLNFLYAGSPCGTFTYFAASFAAAAASAAEPPLPSPSSSPVPA